MPKYPQSAWVALLTLLLGVCIDLATPGAWAAGLVYLIPIVIASRHASERFGRLIFAAVVLAVIGDWLWAQELRPGNADYTANAVLVLLAVLCAAVLGRRITRLDSARIEELDALLDLLPNPVVVIDGAGLVQACNEQGVALAGGERDALVGRSIDGVLPLADDAVWSFESDQGGGRIRVQRPDGPIVVLDKACRAMDVQGRTWVLIALLDVTPQQELKDALVRELAVQLDQNRERDAQLTSILDHAEALIAIKDRAGRYVSVNRHLVSMWEADAAWFIGRTDLEVSVDPQVGRWLHETDMALMQDRRAISREEQFPRLPGSTYYTTRFPITDSRGDVIGLGGISIDVTELRQASDLIQAQKASLQRSNEDLERYAHMAAHDLQEPLRMIVSFSQMLEHSLGRVDDDSAEYLRFVMDNAERGQQLVRDLLAYAKLNGDWTARTVDLNTVAGEAAETIVAQFPQADVTVRDLPQVKGDPAQLRLLFENLIGNGVKFNHSEVPAVTVTAQEGQGSWRLDFADNGLGFDPGFGDRVFEIFTRLHERSEFAGTGVGLAICRRVMELHGGDIAVNRTSSQGTTFTCMLPKRNAAGGVDHVPRTAAG